MANKEVFLRRLEKREMETLRCWRNNPLVWKWCRQNDVISQSDQEKWFETQASDPSVKMYGVCDHREMLLGVCGLTSIDHWNRRAEFSLYIAPEHQRKGYAKPALWTLLKKGFLDLGLNCIWGETFHGNHAVRVFEDVGMKKEGRRREFYYREGRFIDCDLYSMVRSDFDYLLYDRDQGGNQTIPA